MIKTLVCWAAAFSVDGTYILKMEFEKSQKISRPNGAGFDDF